MDEPRAVLFDFGGVLLREDAETYDAFGTAHGLAPGEFYGALYETEVSWELRKGRVSRDVWIAATADELRPKWGADAEPLLQEWLDRPPELHTENLELAEELKRSGIRIGVVSNAAAELEARLSEHYGVEVEWDLVLASGAVGLAKPDPRIFTLAAARIGVPVERCFFIDDKPEYLQGAVEVGMPHHRFTGDYGSLRAALRESGYPVAVARAS